MLCPAVDTKKKKRGFEPGKENAEKLLKKFVHSTVFSSSSSPQSKQDLIVSLEYNYCGTRITMAIKNILKKIANPKKTISLLLMSIQCYAPMPRNG